jgi:vacuolar-type H+-ATPase subunit I/STV1
MYKVIGVGLVFAWYINRDSMRKYKHIVPDERRDNDRYTMLELKKVVGTNPPQLWSDEQLEKLDSLFKHRVEKYNKIYEALNIRLEENKKLHPEKYPGLMQLIAYGPPDHVLNYRSSRKDYYESYKHLEEKDSDVEYETAMNEEQKKYEKYQFDRFKSHLCT